MTGPRANVADLVAAAAGAGQDRPAIVEPDGTVTTWGALEDRVAGVAGALRAAGIEPHDRVAIVLGNGADFAAAYWGTLRAGATVVPVNPGYTAPERQHLLDDSGARAVVTDDIGGVGTDHATMVLAVASLTGPPVTRAATGDDDCAVICYTSGTTGQPKGARLTHANLLANLDAFAHMRQLTLESDDVQLGVLPFFHVFGLNVVLNAAAMHRSSVAAVERFSPRGTAALMADRGVTVAYGAPPVFAALAALPADVALPRLRAAVSGADALPVRTWERFRERFGIEIIEGYGLTETSPVLASSGLAEQILPGTVGHALPGVRLRLVDPTGAAVPVGEVGEIQAAGPNVFAGYHGRAEESAEVLRDGWFSTGDLGSFDDQGNLRIAGRLKEMIIVSGFNVYPREVEDALRTHPAVAEAAVVGLPDERTGERVRAVVTLAAGESLTVDGILDHARTRLARYKLPREVHILPLLPRLSTGKVNRRALRDPALDADREVPHDETAERA